MADEEDGKPYNTGRNSPPLETRFKKGTSGNKRGRPKGSRQQIPFDVVLGMKVTVSDSEGERLVEAAQAFLLYLQKCWAKDDPTARKLLAKVLKAHSQRSLLIERTRPRQFVITLIAPHSPNGAFLGLQMGVKLDATRPTAHIRIEPWLVEASLKRFGDRRLTREEQLTVVNSTRTPSKVTWPDWWEVIPDGNSLD